jgi:hypothetical protein
MKEEAHLLGLQATKMRWESNTAPDEALEDSSIPPIKMPSKPRPGKEKTQQNQAKER